MTRLAVAAESSLLRLDPVPMSAQTPASSATTETAAAGGPASAEELAKKLSNPVSSLISRMATSSRVSISLENATDPTTDQKTAAEGHEMGFSKGMLGDGEKAVVELMMATHTGMTTEEFEQVVKDWVATAEHPRFKRLYPELVHQPMLELLVYVRANGFKTSIVSGGCADITIP